MKAIKVILILAAIYGFIMWIVNFPGGDKIPTNKEFREQREERQKKYETPPPILADEPLPDPNQK